MAPHDHLIRAIIRDIDVRICAVVSTDTVAEAARRHGLTPAGTCAVGKAISAGLLLATLTKGTERVTVQLSGGGPIGQVTADANSSGEVRAYAQHPEAGGEFTGLLADLIGRDGVVNVTRDLGMKDLYQGQVRITTGEVDEDVEAYLRTSEQVPSALGCEVLLEASGKVAAAAGLLVQTLPGGDPEAVREIQHALRTGRLRDLLASGERSARAMAQQVYASYEVEFVGDERPVRFQCRCSPERIEDTLQLLTIVDLDEMIALDKPAEIICNFCNRKFEIGRTKLEEIRAQIAGRPRESN